MSVTRIQALWHATHLPTRSHLDNITVSQCEGQFGLFQDTGAILQRHLQVHLHHLALEWAAGAWRARDQGLLPQQSIPCMGQRQACDLTARWAVYYTKPPSGEQPLLLLS